MKKILCVIISSLFLLSLFIIGFFIVYNERNTIRSIYLNENDKIVIELDNSIETECGISSNNNITKWIKSKNNKCIIDYNENNDYIYLKNKYNTITKHKNLYDLNIIKEFTVDNKIYLAVGGKEKINYTLKLIKGVNKNISFNSKDNSIATVDSNGTVIGKSTGSTQIILNIDDYSLFVDVIVTDKILVKPMDYDYKKEYIKCNEFTKEENDLLDTILASRIRKVGEATRASVVEASRFLTLEFSKRIPYFGENGRLSYPEKSQIDGEGRYYKKGLFLNDSRYENISKSMYGPATWGCKIYSYPNSKTIPNGLDCSGFVAWAFINAGFDVGDIGAGITPVNDFTDLGDKKYIINSINNNSIRVGDLLSGSTLSGGHIAIVMGIKDEYYYIAESLYSDSHTYYGVVARKYKFDDLKYYFSWHIDMDDFYPSDGVLTDYWIY